MEVPAPYSTGFEFKIVVVLGRLQQSRVSSLPCYLTHRWVEKRLIHTVSKSIFAKVNTMNLAPR